jgi:hypothetical protein
VAERTPPPAEEARHLHACLFHRPLDAVVIARYEMALQVGHALACPGEVNLSGQVVSTVVTRRLDPEAVEFALRRRGLGRELARRMQILCYLVEVRPDYLSEFVNLNSSRSRAWAALLAATLRSGWKLLKGEYLVRRHGLV